MSIEQDAKNAKAYLPLISQSGLTLPDRDYYLNADQKSATSRDQFRAYTTRVLDLAGVSDSNGAAESIFTLEKRLAEAQWTAERSRDVTATYNKFTSTTATAQTPGLNWNTYLNAARSGRAYPYRLSPL